MRLLLDTRTLIWAVVAPERLSATATSAIIAADAEVYASHASLWELAIKRGQGRLDVIDRPALAWFREFVARSHLLSLSITADHLGGVEHLPPLHRDPFDRLLVAQALDEGLRIVTCDAAIEQYDVECLW